MKKYFIAIVVVSLLSFTNICFAKKAEVPQKSVETLQKEAESGQVKSQFVLGLYYLTGRNVKKDFTKAVFWITKAAEKGDATAQNHLGRIYHLQKKELEKAVYWYNEAVKQNFPLACFNLGNAYLEEESIKDIDTGIALLTKAANSGFVNAQYKLALLYEEGALVKQDEQESVKWYKKAADAGHLKSKKALANKAKV